MVAVNLKLRLINKKTGQPVDVQRLDLHLEKIMTVTEGGATWSVAGYEVQVEERAAGSQIGQIVTRWEPVTISFES